MNLLCRKNLHSKQTPNELFIILRTLVFGTFFWIKKNTLNNTYSPNNFRLFLFVYNLWWVPCYLGSHPQIKNWKSEWKTDEGRQKEKYWPRNRTNVCYAQKHIHIKNRLYKFFSCLNFNTRSSYNIISAVLIYFSCNFFFTYRCCCRCSMTFVQNQVWVFFSWK